MNKVTKVLLIVNSLGFGGAEKHTVSLANGLSRTHLQLSLAYLKPQEDLLDQLNADSLDHLFCCNIKSGFEWQAVRLLACHIRDNCTDVILCTNQYALMYGYLAGLISGRKCRLIEVFHTTELPQDSRRTHQLLYRQLFSRCNQVIFVSQNQQDYWVRKGLQLKSYKYIHNGVDADYFQDVYTESYKRGLRQDFGLSNTDYVVGICAAFRKEKNHIGFLQAINKLRDQGVPIKALLIGDGPLREEIEKTIKHLSLQDMVRITGFHPDVRPLISICDCMVLNSTAVETFSIAVLESMALGKPMISTAIGGVPEQITHGVTGFLFPKDDVNALAKYIHILSERVLREKMGQAARTEVVKKFSMQRMLLQYESVLLGSPSEKNNKSRLCLE